jgi:hypothetical protein
VLHKVHGRGKEFGMHIFNVKNDFALKNAQFLDNGLVPSSVLREMEKLYQNNEARLNTAFTNYHGCSGLGKS